MVFVLSGIKIRNTPPKNFHAASHASIAVSVVSRKHGYAKRWRVATDVKIQARNRRRLPSSSGSKYPIQPVSTCSSSPGAQSRSGTVVALRPNSSSSTAKRCSVAYDTCTPCRCKSLRIFVSRTRCAKYLRIVSRCVAQSAQPVPRSRCTPLCTATSTRHSISSVSAASPWLCCSPACSAART